MATKHCIPSHFNLILICLAAILISQLFPACNNSGDSDVTVKPGNWVTVHIKFNPNTTEQQRDQSIKAIQKMLLNSVTPLMKQYKDYYPSMKLTTTPFTDTLQCWISVMNTYGEKTSPMYLSISKGPDPPTCPQCPTTDPCRICDTLKRMNYPSMPLYGISDITLDSTIISTK
jgi:hypothetical protein